MAPKDIRASSLGSEILTLYGNRAFRKVIKWRIVTRGDYLDYQ